MLSNLRWMSIACLATLAMISMSSCRVPSSQSQNLLPPIPSRPISHQPLKKEIPLRPATSPKIRPKIKPSLQKKHQTTVSIYQIDRQCQKLAPTKFRWPKDQSLDLSIAHILQQQDIGDLGLAYRVTFDRQRKMATIDLRTNSSKEKISVAGNNGPVKRQLSSLSICEQLAIFGGLRQTLIYNAQWHIKIVKFTHQGQEIVF